MAWAFTSGDWPALHIDHINGVKSDNRIANLREATPTQNNANLISNARNTTGFKGVSRQCGRYVAMISKDNKDFVLGRFDSPTLAAMAYDNKAKELFGEFANLNFKDEL